jgi:hypothetical protein
MRKRISTTLFALALIVVSSGVLNGRLGFAEEAPAPAGSPEPPKAEAPAAGPGTPAVATPAPKLPPYFTATSPDPKTPLWPDPTGANTAVWATPGEVRNLLVSRAATLATLNWAPPLNPGCVLLHYDTIRSLEPALLMRY